MCYPDIPYGHKEGSSFLLPGEVIGYLERFIQHFKIAPAIRLRHQVINIRPQPDTNAWTVTTRNILESTDTTAVFDAIMVCNGHYAVASFPENLPGRDVFRGRQVHSHTFRGADEFAGQSVLVIGGGPSSQDIAWNIRNVTTKLRISAHGLGAEALTTTFGKTVVRPDIAALTETGVRYADGIEEEFDTILYCTGYVYSFPFLDDECGITYRNNHVRPLYKQCVHIERPTMFFIGLTDFDLPAAVMDAQSRFVVSLLQNKWQLPVRKEMERIEAADLQRCWDLGYLERNAHRVYHFVVSSNDFSDKGGDWSDSIVLYLLSRPITWPNWKRSVVQRHAFRRYCSRYSTIASNA